jgi:D-alanyl-D-alanine carboxypeptidase
MTAWPTQSEVLSGTSVYGNPRGRNGQASPKWEAENLVYVKTPYTMTYAGKPLSKGCKVHKHCAPSLFRVFENLYDAAGGKASVLKHWGVTIYGGGYNFRLMRGGNNLSMHSYGCAIDLDPANNWMYDRTPRFAEFPKVLAAFAAEGWRWGGDWNGNGSSADERRADGMHWQATR